MIIMGKASEKDKTIAEIRILLSHIPCLMENKGYASEQVKSIIDILLEKRDSVETSVLVEVKELALKASNSSKIGVFCSDRRLEVYGFLDDIVRLLNK